MIFFKKGAFLRQAADRFPYRDPQRSELRGACPGCGGPLYAGEPADPGAVCPRCARRNREIEEDAMTLQEMGAAYRDQARVLHRRIRELEQLRARTEESEERIRLTGRIDLLQSIWRETRELSVLLERYYERGYRRNERYTL